MQRGLAMDPNLASLALAALAAALFGLLLIGGLGRRGPGPFAGFLYFFVVLLLIGWTAAIWVRPVGPTLWGVYWVPLVGAVIVFTLMLAALSPSEPQPVGAESAEAADAATVGISIFAIVGVVVLVAAIIAAYV